MVRIILGFVDVNLEVLEERERSDTPIFIIQVMIPLPLPYYGHGGVHTICQI